MSALRRNFVSNVEMELRAVEHTLTYLEAALKGFCCLEILSHVFIDIVSVIFAMNLRLLCFFPSVPCHRMFIAHYEHVLADPKAFIEPLSTFLELDSMQKEVSLDMSTLSVVLKTWDDLPIRFCARG
jgi:hypothetical protein